MQNKRPRRQAIDNFVPTGSSLNGAEYRNARRFPDVGVTMSPYRNGPLDPTQSRRQHSTNTKAKPKRAKKRWTKKRIALLILLPFLLVGLWLGFKFGFNVSRIFNGNIFSIFSTTRLKGEDEGRVNILLAGNSADDPGHNGGELTDSIMIMSLDTRNNRAFLLSIPRDLYVSIPGYGSAKINEAYVIGKNNKFSEAAYPKGGMGLLEKTIYENLGVKTHYYALINYSALKESVDAVGGVTVNIDSGSSCGLYDPSTDWSTGGPLVDLSNGTHTLNGREALGLARARGDARGSCGYAKSDFARTENQRMLLLALKAKVFSTGVLANPLKVSKLFDALGKNVKTDMQLSEVRRLNDLMSKVGSNQIKSYGLDDINGKNYLMNYRTATGQSALVPAAGPDDFTEIKQAIRKLMSTNKVAIESANVVLLNGTDTYGLAGENEDLLERKNVTVSAIADARENSTKSYIIVANKANKSATLELLKSIYGPNVRTNNPYKSQYSDANFIVVLGDDRIALAN